MNFLTWQLVRRNGMTNYKNRDDGRSHKLMDLFGLIDDRSHKLLLTLISDFAPFCFLFFSLLRKTYKSQKQVVNGSKIQ